MSSLEWPKSAVGKAWPLALSLAIAGRQTASAECRLPCAAAKRRQCNSASRQLARGTLMAKLNINGKVRDVQVEPDTPLLWVLREHVGLTGTKYGCGVAQCGACSVHINGDV